MKYFSMFAGAGGFDLALNNNGHECIGYSEIDKYACLILKKHFPKVKNYEDATKIIPEQLPDFDILVGGFPCQSFSIAGKRKGFEDTRGTLFFDVARIINIKRPRLFLLENVKGLLSHDNGNTFRVILETIQELGYEFEYQVLNSKYFGVPQNRERVFIIGYLRGKPRLQVFPIKRNGNSPSELQGQQIHPTITGAIGRQGSSKEYKSSLAVINTIKARHTADANGSYIVEYEQLPQENEVNVVGMLNQTCQKRKFNTPVEINQFLRDHKPPHTLQEIADVIRLPKTQVEHYFRLDQSRAIPSPENWVKLKTLLDFDNTYDKVVTEFYEKKIEFEQTRRVYGDKGLCPTINATATPYVCALDLYNHKAHTDRTPALTEPHHNSLRLQVDNKIRRLTPVECERLQGFPDGHTEGVSDSQRYKLMGNAVTVNVVDAIIKRLK